MAVQRKVPAEAAEQTVESDKLLELLDALGDFFETLNTEVADYTLTGFDESTERIPFSPDLLAEMSVFSGFFGLEFTR